MTIGHTPQAPPEPAPQAPPEPVPPAPSGLLHEPGQAQPHRRAADHTSTAPGAGSSDGSLRPSNKRTWGFGAIIIVSLLLIAAYYAAHRADSWLVHWKRHTIVRDLASLQVRIHATGLPVSQIGRVEIDGAWLPVPALRRTLNTPAQPAGAARAEPRLCVFSGVHGNEPAAVEAVLRFAESLAKDRTLYPGLNLTIVPLVNPWGWARNLRRNSSNHDISRSFVTTPSAEGEIVKALLKEERCTVVADLHGDSTKQAFHVISFDNADLSVAKLITRDVAARGLPLRKGAPEGVFHRLDKDAINTARPSLGLYARRNGVPQVYTIQSPREIEIETRVGIHLLALDRLARSVKP